MGEAHERAGQAGGWLFEPSFNRSIKLPHADPRITSDAGALLLREVDHRLGLTADLGACPSNETRLHQRVLSCSKTGYRMPKVPLECRPSNENRITRTGS